MNIQAIVDDAMAQVADCGFRGHCEHETCCYCKEVERVRVEMLTMFKGA